MPNKQPKDEKKEKPTMVFVNLPVKDLDRSIGFFTRLGFNFNPQFTNEKATCMIISDLSYVMLLDERFFQTFTKKKLSDASSSTEVIVALSAQSKKDVDEMMKKALLAGGKETREPQDLGWMYQRSFQDIDGHLWEVVYMEESALNQD